ncbi:hypothetical protein BGZ60DRAFT_385188 [Tricladium varicosporioides]|nr:hypothetical protein BGZ60DRAFT_385188 [Hymenoscyphus varicosporioides]
MPHLPGFSDNPLRTRADLITAVYTLLEPLIPYQSPKGARIRLPVSTATHFDETAAQLEGFARPLWAITALLTSADANLPVDKRLQGWINGFAAGTDPTSGAEEYWGDVSDTDQRMVEIEILGFALLAAPRAFLGAPDSVDENDIKRRSNITKYLKSVNGKSFPQTNWLWFRVMANLALVKSCGVPYDELKESMNTDLEILDTFYIGGGWASDGSWCEDQKQMDYYSGSFAIQFSQCVYIKYAADIDPKRVELYKDRARSFASDFWRYFDKNGASIPFGRSLTYRFAMGGFWAAVAMAEIDLPAPLTPGVVKGLLLRHLRYWASKPDIFYPDGTLNIGFMYPNMYMCEDYNSPQSPYWCMKTFVMLTLPEDHAFWVSMEESLPSSAGTDLEVKVMEHPKHILVDSGNHHFLLSSGQYCGWPLKATEAKYCKFAYSSSFGFSVPTGPLIQQMAPDNTLALTIDDRESWRVRWRSSDTLTSKVTLIHNMAAPEEIPALVNVWFPSKAANLMISTTLIPSTKRWPDWHIRVHKCVLKSSATFAVSAVEGGFAIYGRKSRDGLPLSPLNWAVKSSPPTDSLHNEGILEDETSALIISNAGASGVRYTPLIRHDAKEVKGLILKPDSNTNLMTSRTLIPTIQQELFKASDENYERGVIFATAVFAVARTDLSSEEIRRRWFDFPRLRLKYTEEEMEGDYIKLS